MEELADALHGLLGSPEGMQKLQQAAAALSTAMGEAPPASPPSAAPTAAPAVPDGVGELASLAQLLPLFSGGLGGDDENTALLKALRPYLQEERRHRLDDAIRIMKLMKLLPLLSELGGGQGGSLLG